MGAQKTTFDDAVAKYIKEFRTEHKLTLDQVANAARQYGAPWSPASVRSIEQGESSLTLDKLIYLALAVRLLTPSDTAEGNPISLRDLFGDAKSFKFGDPAKSPTLKREWIDDILSGEPVTPRHEGFLNPIAYSAASHQARNPEEYGFPSGIDAEDIYRAEPTGAELRAAKKLGLKSAQKLSVWAKHLWGHSLDNEAAARAGKDATPQARGRVTRLLTQELSDAMGLSEDG